MRIADVGARYRLIYPKLELQFSFETNNVRIMPLKKIQWLLRRKEKEKSKLKQ